MVSGIRPLLGIHVVLASLAFASERARAQKPAPSDPPGVEKIGKLRNQEVEPARNPVDTIARILSEEMASWRTLELVSREDSDFFDPTMKVTDMVDSVEVHRITTADDKVACDVTTRYESGAVRRARFTDDGETEAIESFPDPAAPRGVVESMAKNDPARLRRGPRNWDKKPGIFKYLTLQNKPVFEKLRDAEYLGTTVAAGRACEAFRFHEVFLASAPLDMTYEFDKVTGIPLKVSGLYVRGGKKEALQVWEALRLERREGHLFPVSSRTVQYKFDSRTDEWVVRMTIDETSLKVAFAKQFPPATFRPSGAQ
jgi:hypothetical protein